MLVTIAVVAYGDLLGGFLAYVSTIIAMTVSFSVQRLVGGGALMEIKNKFVARIMINLEDNPVLTVVFLRTLTLGSPDTTTLLALGPIGVRDFIVGSALGLAAPLAIFSFSVKWLLKQDIETLAFIGFGGLVGSLLALVAYWYFQKTLRGRRNSMNFPISAEELKMLQNM